MRLTKGQFIDSDKYFEVINKFEPVEGYYGDISCHVYIDPDELFNRKKLIEPMLSIYIQLCKNVMYGETGGRLISLSKTIRVQLQC